MKSHARVAIVGGGIMGVGLLYHLALEGWTELVLVEKSELTSGSTWHAAGQCPHFISSLNAARLHVYGTQLYASLEAKTGQAVSWHTTGGLRLACSDEEVDWFKQVLGVAKLAGYEAHIISPNEIPRHHPFLDARGVKAAFLTVTDGHVAPADATMAMAAGARALGAEIYRRTRVMDIRRLDTGEWLVTTDQGELRCGHVVNAGGSYCNAIASWTGHRAPIANMLHHYLITEPVAQLIAHKPELPVVRDPWAHAYFREEVDGILVGPYETSGAHECWDGPPAWDFESELVAPELDRIMPHLERAGERFPLFAQSGIKRVVSGAIPHTPDGAPLSGPAPGARNYWLHCGASLGICQGAGISRFLAQCMVHGQPDINAREFDPRRFGEWATPEFTRAVGIADYQHMYYCYRPAEQHNVGRDLRRSSLHDALKARGAQFSQVFGWERARWYDLTGKGERFSFKRSNWWDDVRHECLAVRERVGLIDLSSFAKFEITGPDAYAFLERVCPNRVPRVDGRLTLSHLLNANGFVDSEITVTRLASDRFYVVSSAAAQLHDFDQMRGRVAPDEQVMVADVTDAYGVIVLAGPRARDVLACCADADISNSAFRWLTGKQIAVAGVSLRALRVNYVGELGWELHTPMAELPVVFEALQRAGEPHGLTLFGTYAMNSLRMEKAYHAWGAELTNEVTLIAADLERFVDFGKDFIGKPGTLSDEQDGPPSRLVYLSVGATDHDCYGNEPVYHGDRCRRCRASPPDEAKPVEAMVRRRELICRLGSAATAWPLALHAQQKATPVIGFLGASMSDRPSTIQNLVGFRQGLSEAGYVEGQNVVIEYRWAEGHYDRLPSLAADHVNRKVDMIVATGGTPSALAAKSATSTIPIIFLADSAMVTAGLANSFAKPGSNLTGFIIFGHELTPKRLELLSELVPQARVIALLLNPTKPDAERLVRDMQEAARAKGMQLPIVKAGTEGEIDAVFASLVQQQIGALVVASGSFFSIRRAQIVALASRHAVATIYDWREFPVSGDLISYGISFVDSYRQVGTYAGKILNGAKPADLPVQQPTRFEMVVNLKTAQALGLTIPPSILARADEVIE